MCGGRLSFLWFTLDEVLGGGEFAGDVVGGGPPPGAELEDVDVVVAGAGLGEVDLE